MRKIINIVLYILCIVFLVITFVKNPYLNDLYNKKVINSDKTFEKYFNKNRFVCIDLKDSEMTRFKEDNSDSIVYVSSYSNKKFISVLTKGTSLSDKVCGVIKDKDKMSNELSTSIEKENISNILYFSFNSSGCISIWYYCKYYFINKKRILII